MRSTVGVGPDDEASSFIEFLHLQSRTEIETEINPLVLLLALPG